jgi:TonB family protein
MPGDPKELLSLAIKSNGLDAAEMKPWHLKASFEEADNSGKTTDQGSIEEFWAASQKWKLIYVRAGSTHTIYGTDHGNLEAGSPAMVSPLLREVSKSWLTPTPKEAQLEGFDLSSRPVEMGAIKLNCVFPRSQEAASADGLMYCFIGSNPTLRMSVGDVDTPRGGTIVMRRVFNKSISFQGRYVASSLNIHSSYGGSINAHIESLDLLPSVDEAEFTPPPDAKAPPKIVSIAASVAQGYLLYHVTPEYPSAARDARMSGLVVIEAVIAKDGRIRDAKVISGAKIFQGAALAAIRQWTYRPYLLNGEPVDVNTTINVVFNLGTGR